MVSNDHNMQRMLTGRKQSVVVDCTYLAVFNTMYHNGMSYTKTLSYVNLIS